MNYIERLEKMNISFNGINKSLAQTIIETEYPYYKLIEYSSLYEKYTTTNKKGKFINLDFEHLYSLAKIDEEFSNIILCEFLELERTIKAIILSKKIKYNIPSNVVEEYVSLDEEYLNHVYRFENRQVLLKYENVSLKGMTIEQFLDVIQFGTLEKFYNYLYKTYFAASEKYYGYYISSAYKLRNIVAHYEALISQLNKNKKSGTQEVSSFLGNNGVNHKTLKTNMSKPIVLDYCNMLYLYYLLQPDYKLIQNYSRLNRFLKEFCEPYFELLNKNEILKSFYYFICNVIEIFHSHFQNKIT